MLSKTKTTLSRSRAAILYDGLQATLAEVEVHSGGGCTADNTTHNLEQGRTHSLLIDHSRKVQLIYVACSGWFHHKTTVVSTKFN